MSIIDSFDLSTNAIVEPNCLVRPIDNFPETVIATFKSEIIEELIKNYNVKVIDKLSGGFTIPIYKIDYAGKEIAMYQTLIGGAGTAGLLEEVIVKGGRKILFFGSCGTLDKSLSEGHLIIPIAAYRDEGVSYHYLPNGDYINVKTAKKLSVIFDELELPYIMSKTWTTDALYRETGKNMNDRKAEGCLAVDMECASIMAVSEFRGVDAYQFLYAEDNLDASEWEARSMGRLSQNEFEKYLNIAIEVASKL